MSHCVYPRCTGSLAVQSRSGYCGVCHEPVRCCDVCGAWNRAAAAWCRMCGKTLGGFPREPEAIAGHPGLFAASPARIPLNEPAWCAPQAAGGCLWSVTASGQLYRLSPFRKSPSAEYSFGEGYRYSHFVVRDMLRETGRPSTEPYGLVASPRAIAAVGLVSRTERGFDQLEPGEAILADCVERYWLIDSDARTAWVLASQGDSTSLLGADLLDARAVRHPLGKGPFGGPVRVKDQIVAWSRTSLSVLAGEAIRQVRFPAGFEAWTEPNPSAPLRIPLGKSPAIVSGSTLYLPGSQGGRPALLMTQLRSGASPMAVIPIGRPASCGEDASGLPLLTFDGQMMRSADGALQEVRADSQMSAMRVGGAAGDLQIYFYETAHYERLRTFCGHETHDISLNFEERPLECIGFWVLGAAVMACLLTHDRQTEFLSWHL